MKNEEIPVQGSPVVLLNSGNKCIPQHFLQFNHTVESVRRLFKRVSFSNKFNPYIYEENDSLCLQIEIVGHENYPRLKESKREVKRVYGRKWRIEKNLPTSEILQTAVLAIKKALEHEIRELFTYKNNGYKTTPLNNHQDFPLIIREFDELVCKDKELCIEEIKSCLRKIKFNKQSINLINMTKHNSSLFLLDIQFGDSKKRNTNINFFRWLELKEFTIILKELTQTEMMYSLMELIIKESDRYVEENFLLDGSPRFSRKLSPVKISQLSLQTRNEERLKLKKELILKMKEINKIIDMTRVPSTL